MQNLICESAWEKSSPKRPGKHCVFFTLTSVIALFILLLPSNLSAQGSPVYWTQQNSFKVGYQFNTSASTLTAGQHFSLNLYLSTEGGTQSAGGTFHLDLSGAVSLDLHSPPRVPAQSWLGSSMEVEASQVAPKAGPLIHWRVARTDYVLKSGSGVVLKLDFVVGNQDVSTLSVVNQLTGGLIIEENMDMKREGPEEGLSQPDFLEKVTAYPNPCHNLLYFHNPFSNPLEIVLRDLSGKKVLKDSVPVGAHLDLGHLAPGLFCLEIRTGGHYKTIRLVKQ